LTRVSEAPVKFSNRVEPKQAGVPLILAGGADPWLSPGPAGTVLPRFNTNCEALPAAFTSATAAVTTWDYREGTNALWKKTDAAEHSVVYAYGADGLRSTKTNARSITTT
jgi:hypothetical protein